MQGERLDRRELLRLAGLLGVLPQDAAAVDLPHPQQHVTDQVPVRVLIRTERGVTYAREVVDLVPSE